MRKFFYAFALLAVISFACWAQNTKKEYAIGVAGIYNFQTESFGGVLMGDMHLSNGFSFLPEVTYFLPFNPVHELYAGLSVHYEFNTGRKWHPYLSASAYYNNWMNSEDYSYGVGKKNNFTPEFGVGIIRAKGCIRPFIENRYNVKWKEDNLRIGILWFFNSCKAKDCPAFGTM